MVKLIKNAVSNLIENTGSCLYCIRRSFLYSAFSWLVAAALFLLKAEDLFLHSALAISAALTALWVIHLLVFAGRSVMANLGNGRSELPDRISLSRRGFLPTFGLALAFIAAASTVPRLALANSAAYSSCNTNCFNQSTSCYSRCSGTDSNCRNNCQNTLTSCQQRCCSLLDPGITVPGC